MQLNESIGGLQRSSKHESFVNNNPMLPQAGATFLPPIDFGRQKLQPKQLDLFNDL